MIGSACLAVAASIAAASTVLLFCRVAVVTPGLSVDFAGAGVDAQVASCWSWRPFRSSHALRCWPAEPCPLPRPPSLTSHRPLVSRTLNLHLPAYQRRYRSLCSACLDACIPTFSPLGDSTGTADAAQRTRLLSAIHTNDIALAHFQTLRPSARALPPRKLLFTRASSRAQFSRRALAHGNLMRYYQDG